ncbi:hypothetical protein GCM10010123_44120 [Pilimelia anulata]|uniref:Uncharacterized protein n=1 Tax=Pilimelia anulata TaxID=53371 RepID=A0A8J3BCE2_9ACTN|nr:hypothetical protein [Pilimelia anulata]GGK09415.1 hypothetical protein GCM10010123_44120 [Pilimelia anulata]
MLDPLDRLDLFFALALPLTAFAPIAVAALGAIVLLLRWATGLSAPPVLWVLLGRAAEVSS